MKRPVSATLLTGAACLLLSLSVAAQSAPRSSKKAASKPAAQAAATPPAEAPAADADSSPIGTNIFGDKESPIGLYITPWKNAYAEKGLDRPARLLDEAVEPIDPGTFRRQMEYYQTISDYRRARQQAQGPR